MQSLVFSWFWLTGIGGSALLAREMSDYSHRRQTGKHIVDRR